MVLSGYCSFLLLHRNQLFDRFNGDMRPAWKVDLATAPKRAGIDSSRFPEFDAHMIAAITNSELLDFTIPRAGLVVRSDCGFQQEVRDMVCQ